MQDTPNDYVIVGHVSGLFGVNGWVKVFSYTQPRENIIQFSPWILGTVDGWNEVKLEQGRRQGKGVVAKLGSYDDRDAASKLIGNEIALRQEQLPRLAENEFYWNDLTGLQVINQDEINFGVVERLIETGSNDVMIVSGDHERLVPYIWGQVIRDIDLEEEVIRVDWDPDF